MVSRLHRQNLFQRNHSQSSKFLTFYFKTKNRISFKLNGKIHFVLFRDDSSQNNICARSKDYSLKTTNSSQSTFQVFHLSTFKLTFLNPFFQCCLEKLLTINKLFTFSICYTSCNTLLCQKLLKYVTNVSNILRNIR